MTKLEGTVAATPRTTTEASMRSGFLLMSPAAIVTATPPKTTLSKRALRYSDKTNIAS